MKTDQRCILTNQSNKKICDEGLGCSYFMEQVLPASWDLNDLLSYALWYDDDRSADVLANDKP